MALNKALRLGGTSNPDDEEQNPNEGQETSESGETYDNGLPNLASGKWGGTPTPKSSASPSDYPSPVTATGSAKSPATFPDPVMPKSGNTGVAGGQPSAQPQPLSPAAAPTATPSGQASGYSLPTDWGSMDPSQYRSTVEGYYKSRNTTPQGTSLDYWSNPQKVQELLKRGKELNPSGNGSDYLNKFLSNAEEFTGGPQQTAQAMWGTGSIGSGGGTSRGVSSLGSGPMSDAIQRLLARGESSDLMSPAMQSASSAHRQALDRGVSRQRSALAERAAASGLNLGGSGSGSFDSAVQGGIENAGIDQANFDSGMQLDEIKARREDVVNALRFAQGEERMALEEQLAQMNNQLQRAQMGQQNQQFYDQFSNSRDQFDQTYNLDYLKWLASQGAGA